MSISVTLRSCGLTSEVDQKRMKECGIGMPIGQSHANDGIATPDGFQWGHKITFMVEMWPDTAALQVMSWSRLAKSLKHIGGRYY